MTLTLPAYRSSRSRWRQLRDALITGYINWQLRKQERQDRIFFDQIEQWRDTS
jgi:hypothetical protein